MSSNTTNLNPASPNSINGITNSSLVHLSSNFSDNNGSMSSTWIAPTPTPEVHQNDLIPQKSSFTADLGQLALSQVGRRGLTEVRKTCVSAQGVKIRTAVSHPSVRNHSVSYTSKVITVTEVTRTTNLNSPLYKMNQILRHNGSATLQNQEPDDGDSFNNMFNQIGRFNNVQPRLTFDSKPIILHATRSVDSVTMQNILGSHLQMVKMDLLTRNQKIDPKLEDSDVKGEKSEDPYNGITHSLPYRKYGPYTCPRCRKVFDRSQTFAAHMNAHYKTESPAERKRRLAAKYKHRDLRKIDANMRKGTTVLQTDLIAVKVKEEVENP